ncbi:MAG: ATP-binding cassette, subfamily bacterial [Acidimicrobiaceae bacterium]|nr:ATP-binding cassette, subfamily bacterial [Acidimicrobiaceae bacterium]
MPSSRPDGRLVRRGLVVVARLVATAPKPFFAGVAGAMVYAAATVGSSWVLGRVVDRVITPRFESGRVATGTVVAGAAAIVAVGVAKAAGIVCRRVGATIAKYRAEATLQRRVVLQYQALPTAWHQSQRTGELLAHAGADAEASTEVMAPLPYTTGVIALLIITAVWLLVTDLFLALVGLLLIPGLIVLNLLYQRRVEVPARHAQDLTGAVSAVAHESFDGALVVKALGAEDMQAATFEAAATELRDARVHVASLQAGFNALLDGLPSVATIAVLVIGAWRVDAGAISPGTLVAFVNLLTLLVWPLRLIGYVLADLSRTVAGFDRIEHVLNEPLPPPHPKPAHLPAGPLDLHVEGVGFEYEQGAPVLEDVTFSIRAGTTVALVGPTGSGKSTLLLLLGRLMEPTQGAVRLGGVDLDAVADDDFRAAVALAFQEPFLFGTTIRDNVLLGRSASDDDVRAALALARLTEFDSATVVGERGATMSGGQRQRLALVRALVGRPRLLLLDDATSAVDPSTEAAILNGLSDGLGTTTTIMVATRPATIALADEVLYVEEGRVVARGSHDDLLRRVPGYARLVRAYEQGKAA